MDFNRLFDLLPYQAAHYAQPKAFAERDGNTWQYYSTTDGLEMVEQMSVGLLNLGVQVGDKVGIFTQHGSPPWNFVDFAVQQIGGVVIPIHATSSPEAILHIIEETQLKICFVQNEQFAERIQEAIKSKEVHIYTFELSSKYPHWKSIFKKSTSNYLEEINHRKAQITEDTLATIIYTSGTTAEPKGVMLSHKNIISNIKAIISLVPINYHKRTFSFLPLSHIFERMVTYTYMVVGASVYYIDKMENIVPCIRSAKPHYFTSVPRFLEKVYDTILERGGEQAGWKRRLLLWAIRVGEGYEKKRLRNWNYWLKHRLADLIVFRRWRYALGGHVEGVVVGAAAMQARLGQLFSAAGIEVREGYGLTETSPVVSFNRFEPGGCRFGTVGIPIPGVEVNILNPDERGEGEIRVKGPNVMLGYFQKEALTQKVISPEGWFHTGDVGCMVHKKFLQITDRKKDIFKTSHGKYVAPQELENLLKDSEFIEQCLIIGFQRPFVAALIIPNMTMLHIWCDENKVHWTSPQFMVINPKVIQHFEKQLAMINENLPSHKQIRKFLLLHKEWTLETGELTATYKPLRAAILENNKKEINKMYT